MTSGAVRREIAEAPVCVQAFFESVLPLVEVVEVTDAAVKRQTAYLRAGIVSPKWAVDALHVAMAATTGCSLIVSWNFAHIVHFDKIALYNEVNALGGHAALGIHSPLAVIGYEDQDF